MKSVMKGGWLMEDEWMGNRVGCVCVSVCRGGGVTSLRGETSVH